MGPRRVQLPPRRCVDVLSSLREVHLANHALPSARSRQVKASPTRSATFAPTKPSFSTSSARSVLSSVSAPPPPPTPIRPSRTPPRRRALHLASARAPTRTTRRMSLRTRKILSSSRTTRICPSTSRWPLPLPRPPAPSSSPSAPSPLIRCGASLISALAAPFSLLPSFLAPSPRCLNPTTSSSGRSSSTPPSGRATSIAAPLASRRASVQPRTMTWCSVLGSVVRSGGRRRRQRSAARGRRGKVESL